MKRILKWVGLVLGILIVLLVVIVGALHFVGQSRLNTAPNVTVAAVPASTDEVALERGEHLAAISGCRECHAANLAGQEFVNEAPIGYIPAPNLTPGGVGATYSDEDWARAIRYGVARDGRVITIMASNHYAEYGDDDLADLIAYLKSVPTVENTLEARQIQFPGTIIFGILAYDAWAVNQINHSAVGGRNAPPLEATAEYGEYLVSITSCGSCHGENLAGNTPDSDSPQGPNITPGGRVNGWTAEDFARAVRAGQTPDGRQLSIEMPWTQYSVMSDTEVQALWVYLQTLEPLPDN
jgi:cytochrome c553